MYFYMVVIKCNCLGLVLYCCIIDYNCMFGGFCGYFENIDKFYGIW